jgi:hypothetical protein
MKLSASAAHRWTSCSGWAALDKELRDAGIIKRTISDAADAGTEAALIAERLVTGNDLDWALDVLGGADPKLPEYNDPTHPRYHRASQWDASWAAPTLTWYQAMHDAMEWVGPGVTLDVEVKVPTFYGMGNCIPDVVCYSKDRIAVGDLKWGVGTAVDAEDNPQLIIGALSVARYRGLRFPGNAEVLLFIGQPRYRDPSRPQILEWRMTWRELINRAMAIEDRAYYVQSDAPKDFVPTSKGCQFCEVGALGRCPAKNAAALEVSHSAVATSVVSLDDKAAVVARWKDAEDAVSAWRSELYALGMAGAPLPNGFYIGASGLGDRKWAGSDEDVYTALRDVVPNPSNLWETKLVSPSALGKLLKNQARADKQAGKPVKIKDATKPLEPLVTRAPARPILCAPGSKNDPWNFDQPVVDAIDFGDDTPALDFGEQ